MQPTLHTAITAARKAGDILLQYREKLDRIQIVKKAHQDYFSEVDILAEQTIIQMISKAYPDHGFIAEESGIQSDNAEYTWLIDPLDGTSNYLHEYPFYCVSIALKSSKHIECGVIYDPLKQECFIAARGEGARLNDRRLRVSKNTDLSESMIGTSFSFKQSHTDDEIFKKSFQTIANVAAGTRKAGAAALELAYVAAGRLDAFIGSGLSSWDLAAGALLVKEAGGIVTDLDANEHYLRKGHILAGNAKVHRTAILSFLDS